MKNEKIVNAWNKIEPGAETKQKIFDTIKTKQRQSSRRPAFKFSKLIVAAAIMLSLTMIVSAVTIAYNIYNGMYMLPGMGVFDGFNENARTMPKVLTLGDATIEMAMTYDKDGVNTFSMVIYAKGNSKTGPKPQEKDYENLEFAFADGTSISMKGWIRERGWGDTGGHYTFAYGYDYNNFPDKCEFTVTNNAGESVKIELLPITEKTIKITDNGIKRIKIVPAAEGSKIYSYKVEVIKPSVLETNLKFVNYFVMDCKAYSKDGTEMPFGGGGTATGVQIFAADEDDSYVYHTSGEMFSNRINPDVSIDKIIVNQLWATITLYGNESSYILVNLPMPMDGERFDYAKPLEVAKIGEFTFSVDVIERDGNNLFVYTSERCVKYSGNENLSEIQFGFDYSDCRGGALIEGPGEYNVRYTMEIPEDYSGTMFETAIVDINYRINGHWEINFE